MLRIIPVIAQAGITGFESPAAEYRQLGLDLDELLIDHPTATFIGQAQGESMTGVGIFDGDLLIVDRAAAPTSLDVVVAKGAVIRFVEVKTRSGADAMGAESVTPAKQRKLSRAAEAWLGRYDGDVQEMAFMVALVESGGITWIDDAFDAV